MQVQITGKNVDVGEALRSRVSAELSSSIGRYFDRDGGGADVVVSREGHEFRVDCAVTLASGQQLTTQGLGSDAHLAFDAAIEKLRKRVLRYKNRLRDHHPQAMARQAQETAAYRVIQASDDAGDDAELDFESSGTFAQPMVIAETETPIATLTVSMAVLELELSESQTIVFRNAAHGGLSVVYRRPDGNIGWIDPRHMGVNGTG